MTARQQSTQTKQIALARLVLCACVAAGFGGRAPLGTRANAASRDETAPVPIGKMSPFWRHRPVLGRWLRGRLGLTKAPAYLCDPALSFPYRKRPYPEEALFADHLTVVRLLGGWQYQKGKGELHGGQEADLAYRDERGQIRYRWGLLAPRLDHYVKNGYSLTIVLDNTPWCFPANAVTGSNFGQSAAPGDFEEWGAFVAELCRQLVKLYGFETVNGWRFRMGTECQGTARFSGTQAEFLKLYDHAADAVKRVLPGAKFGPFNAAGTAGKIAGANVDYFALVDHCMSGRNDATGSIGSPLDFAAVSQYAAPSVRDGKILTANPEHKAKIRGDFWDAVAERHPELRDVSREVHEFGILGTEFRVGGELGARSAAWTFHCIVAMRERGLDRLWHWGATDEIRVGERHQLLTGSGWLYAVLEHTVGGDTYVLTPRAAPAGSNAESDELRVIQSYQRPQRLSRTYKTMYKSIAVVQQKRTFVITSAYNEDRFVTRPATITVSLPKRLVRMDAATRVEQAALTRTNAVHYRIRQDLDAAGLLKEEFRLVPGLLGSVKAMGGRPAWRHVNDRWPRYERIIRESLTLEPFAGEVRSGETHHRLSFEMAPASVVVVVIGGQ